MSHIEPKPNGTSVYSDTSENVDLVKKRSKTTSITPRLNCSYCHKDNKYPVGIQVIRNRQKRMLETPYRLWKDEFDPLISQIVDVPEYRRLSGSVIEANRYLSYLCSEISAIDEALYRERGDSYTVADIAYIYRRRSSFDRVFVYANSLIGKLNGRGRARTAGDRWVSCRNLDNILDGRELSFKDLTPELVVRFITHFRNKSKCRHAEVCHLKQLYDAYGAIYSVVVVKMDSY